MSILTSKTTLDGKYVYAIPYDIENHCLVIRFSYESIFDIFKDIHSLGKYNSLELEMMCMLNTVVNIHNNRWLKFDLRFFKKCVLVLNKYYDVMFIESGWSIPENTTFEFFKKPIVVSPAILCDKSTCIVWYISGIDECDKNKINISNAYDNSEKAYQYYSIITQHSCLKYTNDKFCYFSPADIPNNDQKIWITLKHSGLPQLSKINVVYMVSNKN